MDDDELSLYAIDTARSIFRGAAERMAAHGVSPEDISIAMAYACQDMVASALGDHHRAIDWLRDCADLQERQLIERAERRH